MGSAVDSDAEIDNDVIDSAEADGAVIGSGVGGSEMIRYATVRRPSDGHGSGSAGLGSHGGGRRWCSHGGGRRWYGGGGLGGAAGPPVDHSFGLSSNRVGAPPLGRRLAMGSSVRHRATLEQAQRRLGIQPDGVDVPVHIGRRGLSTTLWWHLADVPCVSRQRTSTGKASRP